MSDQPTGDEFLRKAGILLDCEEVFGWPGATRRCERPYGHSGSHRAEGALFSGARSPRDEERTMTVLTQILNGRTR